MHIEGSYTAGLAAKKGRTYAKDSVDFFLTIYDDNDELQTWGFEAKGRGTAATAAEEERNIRAHISPHLCILDAEVFEEVSRVSERFQVLQHAYVYNFPTVVLAIADNQSDLIHSLIIDFTTELKSKFEKVLDDLKILLYIGPIQN